MKAVAMDGSDNGQPTTIGDAFDDADSAPGIIFSSEAGLFVSVWVRGRENLELDLDRGHRHP